MRDGDKSPLLRELVPLLELNHTTLEGLKNSTVMIVGGGGFMGMWVAEAITALNEMFGFQTKVKIQTLSSDFLSKYASHLTSRTDVSVTLADCRRTVVPDDVQYIVYTATPTNPYLHQTEPTETSSVIVDGVRAVLESAEVLPDLRNILYVSSGSVYGSQPFDTEKLSEDSFQPIDSSVLSNCFAEALRFAESLCVGYRNEARLPIVMARGFAFLGPYQLPTIAWALHNFIADAMNGRPIRILGDGESVRSYLHGADASVWLLRLLAQGQSGGVYNVGSPHGIRLVDAADSVARYFNRKSEVTLLSQAAHLRKTRFVPDTSKIQREFGLSVSVDVERAIVQTIEWALNNKGA
jgi:nucleoside-diphosphate-sugar epimerase